MYVVRTDKEASVVNLSVLSTPVSVVFSVFSPSQLRVKESERLEKENCPAGRR